MKKEERAILSRGTGKAKVKELGDEGNRDSPGVTGTQGDGN